MLLASILIHPLGQPRPELSALVEQNVESLKRHHPELPHKLFGEEDILQLLQSRFSPEVVNAFHALQPYAYKADLARYCILHEHGGVYADLSYYFLRSMPLSNPRRKPMVFGDLRASSIWDTSVGIILSPPRHKALAFAIERVCHNVKRRYYGRTDLCPTGPSLFGKAVATTCEPEEVIMGYASGLPRAAVEEAYPGLRLPEGSTVHCLRVKKGVIALKRKPNGTTGLRPLGMTWGRTYSEMWKAREVYR